MGSLRCRASRKCAGRKDDVGGLNEERRGSEMQVTQAILVAWVVVAFFMILNYFRRPK